nr:PREDICTED: uncharacterized protein LOC102281899 [Bos mutus]
MDTGGPQGGVWAALRSDPQLLAQFYHADEELSQVAAELDSLDGRKDPQRCTLLVSQFRSCQDNVLNIINQIMDACIPQDRAPRDFCVKFPEEIRHDNLAGQLWFGAEPKTPRREAPSPAGWLRESGVDGGGHAVKPPGRSWSCITAPSPPSASLGSHLGHHRARMRALEVPGLWGLGCKMSTETDMLGVQETQEAQCPSTAVRVSRNCPTCDAYVSAMVPVKSPREYYVQQEVIVLFCETVERALDFGYLTQDMIDDYEPALMFTIPRLAIVWPLWVVVSYAHTPKVAIHPPRSSHRAGLPLSQQTRSQVFQARRHPGVGGTPSLDGGTGMRGEVPLVPGEDVTSLSGRFAGCLGGGARGLKSRGPGDGVGAQPGLVVYADGPLNLDRKVEDMSELFRPFHTLLRKISFRAWLPLHFSMKLLLWLLFTESPGDDLRSPREQVLALGQWPSDPHTDVLSQDSSRPADRADARPPLVSHRNVSVTERL